jgi:hypothetical protein
MRLPRQGERKLSMRLVVLATDADHVRIGTSGLEFKATAGSMNSFRCGATSPDVPPSFDTGERHDGF